MTQQLVLKPLGLITQPNKLGTIPQGAMSVADSCYMRQPGMLENAYAYARVSADLIAQDATAIVVATDAQYAWWLEKNGGNLLVGYIDFTTTTYPFSFGNFVDESGHTQTIDTTGRYGTTISRNRLLVTAVNGTFVYDLPTHSLTRSAGLPQPPMPVGTVTSFAGTALAAKSHCMYTAMYVRRYADGYELISVPSMALEFQNALSAGNNLQLQVQISQHSNNGYIVAGDIIQLYRTKAQTFDTSTNTYTNTGSDYLLVQEHIITAAEVASGFVNIDDAIPDLSLGEALYTNAGVKTQDGLALPSPTAKVVCTFKGYTFYFNRKDPPKFSTRAPVWWGVMGDGSTGVSASSRATGIGLRNVTGNTTNGNNTMTAVSAADLVGIVIGQRVFQAGAAFAFNATVTAVGASTITFGVTATATVTGQALSIGDVIEVNGVISANHSALGLGTLSQAGGLNAYLCAACLNFILPQPNNGVNSPYAVPGQPVDVFYTRLSDQLGNITVRATNGHNYSPQLPRIELSESVQTFTARSVPNGATWSEQNEPENCPPLNTAFVGSGEVYAAYPTRDAIWIFASDGLWRLSGTGGSAGAEGFDWRIDPVDSTLIIAGPQSGCVLRDMVFAYTNRGLVQISSDGTIKELSLGKLDDRLPGPTWSAPTWTSANAIFMIADQTNDEIILKETTAASNRYWIYNYINDAFTQDVVTTTGSASGDAIQHGCYSSFLQAPVFWDRTTGYLVSPNNVATRRNMSFKLQPLLGDDPYSLRMWQQLDASFYVPTNASITVQLVVNGDVQAPNVVFSGTAAGTITVLSGVLAQTDGKFTRVSWSIPRNAPAIANTMSALLSVTSNSPVYFQGLAAKFVDLTEQRSKR